MNGELGAMRFIDAHLVRLRQATQAGSRVLETVIEKKTRENGRNAHALDSTSRGARERLRDGVGRRGGEHREAQRGVEEGVKGGGGRQEQRPSKLVTQKLRLDRERALSFSFLS